MINSSISKRATGRAARAGLAALLVAGGVGAAQGLTARPAHAFSPRLAAGSPKPDWRGTDLGNSGDEAVNGPATTPTQVFNANPGAGNGVTQGIEFDGAGNVLFTKGDGFVYSYNPTTQAQNWVVSAGSSTFGSDTAGAASAPVASADGNVYIIDDTGHLDKINAASGASTQILIYGAKVQQTLKVDDATGNLFFGGQDHFINSYTKAGTNNYSVTGIGSTQDGTLAGCTGATSANPLFYGEGALDSGDNFYVASFEPKATGPRSCSNTTFGTLYKVSPTGTILANKPLAGATVGAVTLVPNAAVAGGSEVVVDTKLGYVEAFDSALNRLWATKIATTQLNASPVVDAARNRVYVADTGAALHALNLTTGAVDTAFTAFNATGAMTGTVALNGGTQSSPILDAGGNVYAVDSAGTLFKFDPTGATVWSVPTTIGTGFFGVAIANDGTVYTGGNLGQVSGFNAATGATSTNTPADTATITSADTATSTSTSTAVNTSTPVLAATATNTSVPAATATNTPVNTDTPVPATGTAAAGTDTATPASSATSAPVNTATGTAVASTATNTPVNTDTPAPASTATGTASVSTDTPTPAATATSTAAASTTAAVPTATGTAAAMTAVPSASATDTPAPVNTATGTAAASTDTPTGTAVASMTAIPSATATATVAVTPVGTPTPPCQLFVAPAFDTVPRGGDQALLLDAAPGALVTLTVGANYPATATLYDDASFNSPDGFGTPLVGTRVARGYRYTIQLGASGLAVLTFAIPRNARQGTVATRVAAREACGLFKTVVTFEVRGTVRGADALLSGDGRATTLTFALPRGAGLPAGVGRLARQGLARVVTRGQGARAQRVLVLTYHPSVRAWTKGNANAPHTTHHGARASHA